MKKLLLLVLVVSLGFSVSAQQVRQGIKTSTVRPTEQAVAFAPESSNNTVNAVNRPATLGGKGIVSIINIGTSANAYSYGYGGGQKNILAYNEDINTVTHFHRMGGSLDQGGYSGDLGYDYSTDGGQSFTNMVECYVAENNSGGTYFTDAARYPHHGIYNPEGNTDPANAFLTYYAPTLDATNSNDPSSGWGGAAFGTATIGSASATKNLLSSNPGEGIYRYIPDGYTVTSTGDVWVVDANQDWSSGSLVYTGQLLVNHGVWNEGTQDFDFDHFLLDAPMAADVARPAMCKVEFSPDGQTGYIVVLGDNEELEFAAGTYFPIVWKTTDGGESWDDPIAVEMAGPDGIESIINYITDEDWEALWEPPAPEREEVAYTTAFDFDLTVDAEGNPHIAVGISVSGSDPYSIISGHPYYAIVDIWHNGVEDEWDAYIIDKPLQFRSDINADYSEDSRTQIARSHDGRYVFVSYLDTQKENEEANNFPDIMARGIQLSDGEMTMADGEDAATNVTFLSDGMEQAYFMVMANEVIYTGDNTTEDSFVLPFSYEEMNVLDPGEAVQYKYIQDFEFAWNITGTNEIEANTFAVAQNYPNPFSGQTEIAVTLNSEENVSLNIYNLTGQNVYSANAGTVSGTYNFSVNANDFRPGVYFYTVQAGNKTVSKKMIVE